jgi:hypothetical protein
MTPCSPLSFNRRFGGKYRLYLQGGRNKFSENRQTVTSSGIWRRVARWVSTDVSEEHIASIFRVEEKAQQEPAGGIILWDITLLSWNHWQNKARNGHNRWRRTNVALVSPSEMERQCVCAWRPVRIDLKHAHVSCAQERLHRSKYTFKKKLTSITGQPKSRIPKQYKHLESGLSVERKQEK